MKCTDLQCTFARPNNCNHLYNQKPCEDTEHSRYPRKCLPVFLSKSLSLIPRGNCYFAFFSYPALILPVPELHAAVMFDLLKDVY